MRVQWAESLFDNTVLDAIDDYFPYEWMTLLHKCADNHKNTPAWQHICSLSAAEAEEELMKELEPLNALDKVLSMMKKSEHVTARSCTIRSAGVKCQRKQRLRLMKMAILFAWKRTASLSVRVGATYFRKIGNGRYACTPMQPCDVDLLNAYAC